MLSKFKDFLRDGRRILLLAVLINAAFGFYPLPLFDEDEGFTAEVSREMLERKEWVLLESNFEPRYDKPPLAFWMMAASFHFLGYTEVAARLPGIVASLFLQYLIYAFVRKRYGEKRAIKAGLLVVGTLQFTLMSKSAIADPFLYLFVTAGVFSLIRYAEEGKTKSLCFFMIWNALAFLTKGPVVFLISGVSVLSVMIYRKDASFFLRVLRPLPLLLFFAVVLPWFALSYQKVGMVMIEDFFVKHNVGRFSNAMEGHGGAFWYYFVVLLVGFLPFSLSHIYALYRTFKARTDLVTTVSLVWFLSVFIFFTISATKLPHYLMLGFFPLVLLSSRYFFSRGKRMAGILAACVVLLLIAAPLCAGRVLPRVDDEYARLLIAGFPEVFGLGYYGVQFFCLAGIGYTVWKRSMLFVCFFLISVNVTMLAYGVLQQGPVKELARLVNTDIVMRNHYLPSFSFYRQQAYPVREPEPGEFSVGKVTDFRDYECEVLYEKYGTVWVKIKGPRN